MFRSIRKTLPALCVAVVAAMGAIAPNDAHAQSGFAVGYITGVPMGGAGGAVGALLHQSAMTTSSMAADTALASVGTQETATPTVGPDDTATSEKKALQVLFSVLVAACGLALVLGTKSRS